MVIEILRHFYKQDNFIDSTIKLKISIKKCSKCAPLLDNIEFVEPKFPW